MTPVSRNQRHQPGDVDGPLDGAPQRTNPPRQAIEPPEHRAPEVGLAEPLQELRHAQDGRHGSPRDSRPCPRARRNHPSTPSMTPVSRISAINPAMSMARLTEAPQRTNPPRQAIEPPEHRAPEVGLADLRNQAVDVECGGQLSPEPTHPLDDPVPVAIDDDGRGDRGGREQHEREAQCRDRGGESTEYGEQPPERRPARRAQ